MLPFSLGSIKQEKRFGRKPYPMHAFFRFQLAMPIFRQSTFKDMRRLLLIDHNLKDLCGFVRIPSEATFSRYLKILSDSIDMNDHVLGPLVETFYPRGEGEYVMHVCRDSTAIPARETVEKKPTKGKEHPKKRGRKKKGSPEEKEFLNRDKRSVVEKQVTQ
ncbi:transposase, partial [Sphaerochaeta associata]|uniref:transposase n=1 Tax=Sphaerochaeta associata TaxID=1129264 RepID=UPI002B1FF09A